MVNPNIIRVFEYEQLTTYADVQGRKLTPTELDKLYQFNDKHGSKYFTGIRNGVKFKNYVGVIQIGKRTIEILPKADKNPNNKEEDYTTWHSALLKMLKVCRHIKINTVSEANLKRRYNSLLDVYFEIYIKEVEQLIRAGLVKKYGKNSSNVLALKGQLNFSKNIQQNLVHKERFYTTHQVYDHNHLINQILLKGLTVLNTISNNSILKDKISRLKINFPVVKEVEINAIHFNQLKFNRKTDAYKDAIQIAKMLILNYSPDIKSGQENMLTLLFDMNKLWEDYVYRMLVKNKGEEWDVKAQAKREFWNTRTIKPDIVLTKTQGDLKSTYIIDTKWKVISEDSPGDNDLKQMYAYNMYWEASYSILLYPDVNNYNEEWGTFHKGKAANNKCKVSYVNVLNGGELNPNIGTEILGKFDKS
jgi:5-methylcytosine-specific restriction enzyme subunit McrC